MRADPLPRGGTRDFKRRGWSNGGKNQVPKKSLNQKLTPQEINSKTRSLVLYLQNYAAKTLPQILKIILNTPKNPYFNQKNSCQIFLPKKMSESKLLTPQKSFCHPRHLKSRVPPLGPTDTNSSRKRLKDPFYNKNMNAFAFLDPFFSLSLSGAHSRGCRK